MKFVLYIFILITLISCENSQSERTNSDSIKGMSKDEYVKKYVDSAMKKTDENISASIFNTDTIGMSNAPVRVKSFRVVKSEGGSYRNVYLEYKNYSGKKITAIRFKWYGENAFGEAADLNFKGFGGGFTDTPLLAGETDDGEWNVLSRDLKKIKAAWVTEIVYADGTKWVNK